MSEVTIKLKGLSVAQARGVMEALSSVPAPTGVVKGEVEEVRHPGRDLEKEPLYGIKPEPKAKTKTRGRPKKTKSEPKVEAPPPAAEPPPAVETAPPPEREKQAPVKNLGVLDPAERRKKMMDLLGGVELEARNEGVLIDDMTGKQHEEMTLKKLGGKLNKTYPSFYDIPDADIDPLLNAFRIINVEGE